jgi:hypothetical protein
MEKFDIGLAYEWEYDKDFFDLIERELQASGLSTYIIGVHNIRETAEAVAARRLAFNFYFDRAWDNYPEFEEFGKLLIKKRTRFFNPYRRVTHAIDKATMHLEFITAGINTPFSVIIPPHNEKKEIVLSVSELANLGRPFIIKPCNTTGGGIGVVTGAETLAEIFAERPNFSADKYLIQEKIYPSLLHGRRAWFRCFWAFGKPLITWWDDQTHLYFPFTRSDVEQFHFNRLRGIVKRIADLTQLDFFSTELVFTTRGQYVAVDYVNDQCDMRFQSKHFDGVPDEVIAEIVTHFKKMILRLKQRVARKRNG